MKLNKIEKLKQELAPYDFYEKIERLDLTNLSEADRFYLKNYGIYNIKLRPENFMIRLRISGGRLSLSSLEAIVQIVRQYDPEVVVTARAQLELHGLCAQNVLAVYKALQEQGITTLQTLTDNFRNIVTDVYDGVHPKNRVEVYPLIVQMQELFLNKPEWMGMLPRKFNTAICGSEESHLHFFGNDLFFALAHKEGEWGFNLYLGGKNSQSAQDANLFVLPSQVAEMFEAVAKAYTTYGSRASRSKTRFFHLIEEIGMDAFREKIAQFYPYTFMSKGTFSIQKESMEDERILQNGEKGYCFRTHFGKISLQDLETLLDTARRNDAQVRLGIDQNFYIVGNLHAWQKRGDETGACVITACAGSRYCALSLWDIKEETRYLPLELLEKYRIEVGFSGCLKGCGRHHHADIGLVGLRTNLFGEVQKAARVFLGGIYSSEDARPARLLYYVVPLVHLNKLLEVIVAEFEVSGYDDFETFSREVLWRYSDAFLTMWFLAKLYLHESVKLCDTEDVLYRMLLRHKGFPSFSDDDSYEETIRFLMHRLWDEKE